MKLNLIFYKVLPISLFSGLLLFNFQNCANPSALTSDGQTVASNTGSSGSTTSPNDLFQPVARTPDNNGGGQLQNMPVCYNIKEAVFTQSLKGTFNKDPLIKVVIELYGNTTDKYGRPSTYISFHHSGLLVFRTSTGVYEYTHTNEALIPKAESHYYVPQSVYSDKVYLKLEAFFSGRHYLNLPLERCK